MKTLPAALLYASLAVAGPITIGQWYEFGFDPSTHPFAAGCLPADPLGVPCGNTEIGSVELDSPPWTLTALLPVQAQFTDALLAGDSFSIFDFGALVGSTPVVPPDGFCGLDTNICFANPAVSHASFDLAAGPHSLTVRVQEAQIQGEGFVRLLVVPEPSYLGLVAALLGFGVARLVRLDARLRRGSFLHIPRQL